MRFAQFAHFSLQRNVVLTITVEELSNACSHKVISLLNEMSKFDPEMMLFALVTYDVALGAA